MKDYNQKKHFAKYITKEKIVSRNFPIFSKRKIVPDIPYSSFFLKKLGQTYYKKISAIDDRFLKYV